jgi:hypothetical protein
VKFKIPPVIVHLKPSLGFRGSGSIWGFLERWGTLIIILVFVVFVIVVICSPCIGWSSAAAKATHTTTHTAQAAAHATAHLSHHLEYSWSAQFRW